MTPVLYSLFSSDFTGLGYGALAECTRCEVTEEVNGLYECEFDYPMTGEFYDTLMNIGCTIGVTHDHNGDVQLFDVYKYTAPIDGLVTFYAAHVSYRLAHQIEEGSGAYTSPLDVFTAWNSGNDNIERPQGPTFIFSDYSGMSSTKAIELPVAYNVREVLLSTEDEAINDLAKKYEKTIMKKWPGECVFDRFFVKYYKKRGQNHGVQIRYGKNMESVTRERDTGSIVSRIVPIYYYEDEGIVYSIRYPAVDSPRAEHTFGEWYSSTDDQMETDTGEPILFAPAIMRAGVYDISDLFEAEPTNEEAREAALDYISKNSTWRAEDNIEVSFIDLYESPEYEDIKELEKCGVGDFVAVYHPALGIVTENVEIMSAKYDVLNERFIEMQLNTIRSTLAQVIIKDAGGKTYVNF